MNRFPGDSRSRRPHQVQANEGNIPNYPNLRYNNVRGPAPGFQAQLAPPPGFSNFVRPNMAPPPMAHIPQVVPQPAQYSSHLRQQLLHPQRNSQSFYQQVDQVYQIPDNSNNYGGYIHNPGYFNDGFGGIDGPLQVQHRPMSQPVLPPQFIQEQAFRFDQQAQLQRPMQPETHYQENQRFLTAPAPEQRHAYQPTNTRYLEQLLENRPMQQFPTQYGRMGPPVILNRSTSVPVASTSAQALLNEAQTARDMGQGNFRGASENVPRDEPQRPQTSPPQKKGPNPAVFNFKTGKMDGGAGISDEVKQKSRERFLKNQDRMNSIMDGVPINFRPAVATTKRQKSLNHQVELLSTELKRQRQETLQVQKDCKKQLESVKEAAEKFHKDYDELCSKPVVTQEVYDGMVDKYYKEMKEQMQQQMKAASSKQNANESIESSQRKPRQDKTDEAKQDRGESSASSRAGNIELRQPRASTQSDNRVISQTTPQGDITIVYHGNRRVNFAPPQLSPQTRSLPTISVAPIRSSRHYRGDNLNVNEGEAQISIPVEYQPRQIYVPDAPYTFVPPSSSSPQESPYVSGAAGQQYQPEYAMREQPPPTSWDGVCDPSVGASEYDHHGNLHVCEEHDQIQHHFLPPPPPYNVRHSAQPPQQQPHVSLINQSDGCHYPPQMTSAMEQQQVLMAPPSPALHHRNLNQQMRNQNVIQTAEQYPQLRYVQDSEFVAPSRPPPPQYPGNMDASSVNARMLMPPPTQKRSSRDQRVSYSRSREPTPSTSRQMMNAADQALRNDAELQRQYEAYQRMKSGGPAGPHSQDLRHFMSRFVNSQQRKDASHSEYARMRQRERYEQDYRRYRRRSESRGRQSQVYHEPLSTDIEIPDGFPPHAHHRNAHNILLCGGGVVELKLPPPQPPQVNPHVNDFMQQGWFECIVPGSPAQGNEMMQANYTNVQEEEQNTIIPVQPDENQGNVVMSGNEQHCCPTVMQEHMADECPTFVHHEEVVHGHGFAMEFMMEANHGRREMIGEQIIEMNYTEDAVGMQEEEHRAEPPIAIEEDGGVVPYASPGTSKLALLLEAAEKAYEGQQMEADDHEDDPDALVIDESVVINDVGIHGNYVDDEEDQVREHDQEEELPPENVEEASDEVDIVMIDDVPNNQGKQLHLAVDDIVETDNEEEDEEYE